MLNCGENEKSFITSGPGDKAWHRVVLALSIICGKKNYPNGQIFEASCK